MIRLVFQKTRVEGQGSCWQLTAGSWLAEVRRDLCAVGLEAQAAVYTGVGFGGQGGCLTRRGGELVHRGMNRPPAEGRACGCLEGDL